MCIVPIQLKSNPEGLLVPCGRCTECRARRASSWSFRIQQQQKVHNSYHFITLTYAPEQISSGNSNLTENGFMSLHKGHLQSFFKRLRRSHERASTYRGIKYYACGEYGGKTNRPHYHVILFGSEPTEIIKNWGFGKVHFGRVEPASIGYVLKYMSKPSKIPKHKKDDRLKEFAIMSKGLGKNYLQSSKMVQWHKDDLLNRMYVNIPDGKKASMPRYYKDKLYTDSERDSIAKNSIIKKTEELSQRVQFFGVHVDKTKYLEQEKRIILTPYNDNL